MIRKVLNTSSRYYRYFAVIGAFAIGLTLGASLIAFAPHQEVSMEQPDLSEQLREKEIQITALQLEIENKNSRISTYQEVLLLDDQAFTISSKIMEITSQAFTDISQGDYSRIDAYALQLELETAKFEPLVDRKIRLLEEIR